MTNEIDTLKASGLANLGGMASALGALASAAQTGANGLGGRDILKLDKGMGLWVYGQEGTGLGDDTIVVNPESFQHGVIAWGNASNIIGEAMGTIEEPAPATDHLPPGNYDQQFQFHAAVKSDGTQLVYKTTAHGGKEFIGKLAAAIHAQNQVDPDNTVPELRMDSSSYQHKSYGRIFKPLFEVVAWHPLSGGDGGEPAEQAAPKPAPAEPAQNEPKRTRRRRAAA